MKKFNNLRSQSDGVQLIKVEHDKLVDSAKALGLIKKRKKRTYEEEQWLMNNFLKPMAGIIGSESQRGWDGKKKSGVTALSKMSSEDIFGEVNLTFAEKGRSLADSYKFSPSGASFFGYFMNAVTREIRDRSSRYDLGAISVPRIRKDEDEKTKVAKNAARFGSASVYDKETGEEGDQSAVEAAAIEYQEIFLDDYGKKLRNDIDALEKLNLLAVHFPMVFSRMILQLSTGQVFTKMRERVDMGLKEVDKIYEMGIVDKEINNEIFNANVFKNFFKTWRSSKKESGIALTLDWDDAYNDHEGKVDFLIEIGVTEENAYIYLDWLKGQAAEFSGEETSKGKTLH